ncbi:hypothetical protein N658DRAFT_502656 [Parathielavia hyrcaniae]|uniref:Homeobox domain-containing protein n=1 Tax=Parathielavia hyrcaniae TaxID=113614 RepID=A0AAN6QC92_9PEZI|nr:hypothetical protein N658DRAFT_502656 [Parathielavia hyrcaniae]
MAGFHNTYRDGYRRGSGQPNGERCCLPGIREMVPEIDEVLPRPPWTAPARTPSAWATSPGPPHSSAAAATPPYQYTHSLAHQQPFAGSSADEERGRAMAWQPEPGHSVPRRLPTTLSPGGPPSAVPPLAGSWAPDHDEADPYSSSHQRRYSQGSHGYGGPREPGHVSYHHGTYRPPVSAHIHGHAFASAGGAYGPADGQHGGMSDGDQRSVKRGGAAMSDGEPEERRKRRNFSADTTEALKKWVETRIDNPHFDPKEVAETAKKTGKTRKQIEDWLINYRRRGWHKRKFEIYAARLRDAQAEYRDALHRARDVAAMAAGGRGGDEQARLAAEAHVALVDARVQAAALREQKARREWQEHESKKGSHGLGLGLEVGGGGGGGREGGNGGK